MILSGKEIKGKLGNEIHIDPFDEKQLNPNSYNLRLHDELLVYEDSVLDMKKENRAKTLVTKFSLAFPLPVKNSSRTLRDQRSEIQTSTLRN